MKDKLIEMILKAPKLEFPSGSRAQGKTYQTAANLADFLIANGVFVPPVKVGQTVYYIEGSYYNSSRQTVAPIKVTEISWKCDRSGRDLGFALIANGTRYKFSSISKSVFLTREEAEKALAERSNR